jgi:hypothetical protein
LKDIVGKNFGQLFVLKNVPPIFSGGVKKLMVLCRCACGTKKILRKESITRKIAPVLTCGCLQRKVVSLLKARNTIHGEGGKTTEYFVWRGMKARCYNPNDPSYKDYGGRGIRVYKPWRKSYVVFLKYILKTIGRKPAFEYSIDRIDNNGNYEPGNIRWATKKQQIHNRRKRKCR